MCNSPWWIPKSIFEPPTKWAWRLCWLSSVNFCLNCYAFPCLVLCCPILKGFLKFLSTFPTYSPVAIKTSCHFKMFWIIFDFKLHRVEFGFAVEFYHVFICSDFQIPSCQSFAHLYSLLLTLPSLPFRQLSLWKSEKFVLVFMFILSRSCNAVTINSEVQKIDCLISFWKA